MHRGKYRFHREIDLSFWNELFLIKKVGMCDQLIKDIPCNSRTE